MAPLQLPTKLLSLPPPLRLLALQTRPSIPLTPFPPARHRRTHLSTTTSAHPAPSASPATLTHFAALASTWWDPHGPSRLLHLMNPLRHAFIRSCLAATPTPTPAPSPSSPEEQRGRGQGRDYLDVGCGGGIFTESAARLPATRSVTGVDPSPPVLAVAQAHARRDPALVAMLDAGTLTYVEGGVEALADREGYDVVTVFEVVEHVEGPGAFLEAVGRQVRPGGWLVLSTIARTWASWVTTKLVAEGVLRVVPWGTHEWARYVNESELRGWFERREGWESPRAMGVVYVPGLGWKEAPGGEEWGNYFFGIRKSP